MAHQGSEGAGDVAGFLRSGENPAAALHRNGAAGTFQQGHHILRGKETEGGIEEAGIARHLGKEGIQVAIVGQVAAALAGDIDLFPELLIFLEERDGSAGTGRKQGSDHSGSAAPDNDDIRLFFCHYRFHPVILLLISVSLGRKRGARRRPVFFRVIITGNLFRRKNS